MKIFETARENFAVLGIDAAQSFQKHPFNTKITMAFVLIGLTTFLHVMHIFYAAGNLKERMQSATTTSGSLLISICIITIIFKMRTLFDCIKGFEDVIAMSEWTWFPLKQLNFKYDFPCMYFFFQGLKYPASASMYDTTNRFIEKYGKIILFVVAIIFSGAMLLHCILCFIIYFLTDLGNDAFVLPVPMW